MVLLYNIFCMVVSIDKKEGWLIKHLRIGLCGFGFMGKTHLWAVRNIPFFHDTDALPFSAEITALCASSETPEKSADICTSFGIPSPMSQDAMISDPSIDVIDICTPNPFHYETARKAILAGKHVLCEKPLTLTATEGYDLAELADTQGLICGTVFNNRFLAPVIRAKQIIDEGRLGNILSFDFTYRHNSCIDPERRVGWKQTAEYGGGTLADLGPHVIDLCHYLCGDIHSILAKAQIAFPTHLTTAGETWQTNADEAYYIIATLSCGAVGNIHVSKLTQGANDELSFAVYGTKGALSFSLMNPNYLYFYDATAEGGSLGGLKGYTAIECVGRYPSPANGFPSPKAPAGWLRGHLGCLASYFSCVARQTPFAPSLSDGAYVQSVIEAAYTSHQTGKEVHL